MRSEAILDLLDSGENTRGWSSKLPLPGFSAQAIESLKLSGNSIAALAGETTDKEYVELHRHRNVISNSILSSLHACPRRLLQEKIQAATKHTINVDPLPNIDFVFGHSVGAGVQALFAFEDVPSALYATFLSWRANWEFGHEDFLARKAKTIELAALAVESFNYFRAANIAEWELYHLPNGKPAVEISFCIDLGKTKYFGHIDLILQNKNTGRIAVGEIKTTGYKSVDDANYRNSGQALGYSLVLDTIVGAEADYDVMYFVWSSTGQEWHFLPFAKSAYMKMEWIQDRLIDSGHLEQYFQLEHFPKNGSSCMEFNRRCQFYGECDLVNKEAMRNLPVLQDGDYPVDYSFKLEDLLKRQMENVR